MTLTIILPRAFEKLLGDYPRWVGKIVLVRVISPALSDSPKPERWQVSEIVADSTRECGSLDFIPVHYHQTIKDGFYVPLPIADLVLITGTNATSMEIVITQEKTKKSPLVLSGFMGISNDMPEARQINPWNLGDVAAAIHHGLTMSPRQVRNVRQSCAVRVLLDLALGVELRILCQLIDPGREPKEVPIQQVSTAQSTLIPTSGRISQISLGQKILFSTTRSSLQFLPSSLPSPNEGISLLRTEKSTSRFRRADRSRVAPSSPHAPTIVLSSRPSCPRELPLIEARAICIG